MSQLSKGEASAFEVGLEGIRRVFDETEREGIVIEDRREEREGEIGDRGECGGLDGLFRLLKIEDRAVPLVGVVRAITSGIDSGGGVEERMIWLRSIRRTRTA